MGSQKVKEEKSKETPKEAKAPKEMVIRKWKGKDWFTVISPPIFGMRDVGEIPTTDPQSLIGRNIEMSLADVTGNPSKYTIKVKFKINKVDGSQALTEFHGMNLIKEQIFRIVRKRISKVEVVDDVVTKDGWKLHYKLFAILNRSVEAEIQRKIRLQIMDQVKDFASKSPIEDFVKTAFDGLIQKNIKKFGSKTYPIRFCEIIKIEVKKTGK